jgi:hypothetical protein
MYKKDKFVLWVGGAYYQFISNTRVKSAFGDAS